MYKHLSIDDGADSQTEGEEQERARQIRMQEVKLKPLPYLPTDTETEVNTLGILFHVELFLVFTLKIIFVYYSFKHISFLSFSFLHKTTHTHT